MIELGLSSVQALWPLLAPSLAALKQRSGFFILLNPPFEPYAVRLKQLGLPLQRLLVVHTPNKADFLAAFVDLASSPACPFLLAWPPLQHLSYAELRKCHLACHEQEGLRFLIKSKAVMQQSSPALLRLLIRQHKQHLCLELLKQRGQLVSAPIKLALPSAWAVLPAYPDLLQGGAGAEPFYKASARLLHFPLSLSID
ncbi:hypothetical protein [Agaribacterium haliotis]|uniref:hypothetical protein n=1 Tax=Agaribacterium haliotis TaxID=2013869 RepID=UPI0011788A9B|nr:hypothetical protein [Agaribacterium haliotis]